jgi:hypothetical protein
VLGRWSGEDLGLQAVEFGLVDGARIQQLLGLGDLLGGVAVASPVLATVRT